MPAVDSQLTLHWPGSARTFNPYSNLSLPSWFPVWFMFDQLVHLDPAANVVPQLAERWDISEDGRRYVFHLRHGVTWHDGAPFAAADVAFTYRMLLDPRAGSRYKSLALPVLGAEEYADGDVASVAGLEIIDDHTIAFVLAHPHFGFLATMGFPILPQHILGEVAEGEEIDDTDFALRAPIGTGPFRLATHTLDGDAEFVANSSYWGGNPQVGRLILRRLDDEEALEAFERGEIDIMFIDALDAERVQERRGVRVLTFRTCEYRILMANRQHPALGDQRVRAAIMYAIDRDAVVRDVLKGMGEVISSPLIMPEWTVNHALDGQYPYDPVRARELLAEAGFGSGLSLSVLTGPGAIPARHNAPFLGEIKRYLAEVGIDLEVKIKPVREYIVDYEAGNFELYTCCGASGPDPDFTAIYFHSASMPPDGSNGVRYDNPETDELLMKGRGAADPEERAAIYHRYAEILSHDLPWLPLWHENRVLALNEGIAGEFSDLGVCWLPGTVPNSAGWRKEVPVPA